MADEGQETADLMEHLYGDWEVRVWREHEDGRWVLYLTYRDQTYRLVPTSAPREST